MRYFLIVLFLCTLAFSATFDGPVYAQRHSGYCDQADSTADALDCINRHNRDIQAKMNSVFKAMNEAQDEKVKALLSETQKSWLAYRDAQCAWETALPDTPSLKRVYELSCLTAMTDRRIALLEAIQEREQQDAPREFSAQPRWMNALAHDYPDIFWRYGEWQSADMDCDGEDEQIMTGISVAHIQEVKIDEKNMTEAARHEVEVVISISENPPTGRPRAKLLRLPVSKKQDEPHLCRPAIRLELKDRPESAAGEKEKKTVAGGEQPASKKSCKILHIDDRRCQPLTISWDGKDYALQYRSAAGGAL